MGGKYAPDEDGCNLVPDSPSAYDMAEVSESNFGGTDGEVIIEDDPSGDVDGESRRRASEKDSCGDRAGPCDVEWESTQSNKGRSTSPVFTQAPNRPRHVCVSNFHDVDSGSCGIGMSTLTGRLGLG